MGANLGDSVETLRRAAEVLDQEAGIRVVRASSVYRNPPMGPQDQPDFVNAVLELSVSLVPQDLLACFLRVEQAFGRVRKVRWGPRTLDLDILIYGNEIVNEPGLRIPHTHMLERAFIMVPLAEIDPEGLHPEAGRAFKELADLVDQGDLVRLDVSIFSEEHKG